MTLMEYGIRWMLDDEIRAGAAEWHYEGGLPSLEAARAALRRAVGRRNVGRVETVSREPGGEWKYDNGRGGEASSPARP
ncbi:hypothetical protein [Cellulosimicrobium sp. I38E]|uniref:hypothetical protein n=1 Tax=Cellulosimicrobium sp. I38E TaxID=1393139 RepID=UPI0007B2E0C2|nr:hypothetical protein [Cellulosimicrobium sp. I38E]KZM78387.1 hypothetical protein A0J59_13740 [Cellulosimicrobium sp. I38E]